METENGQLKPRESVAKADGLEEGEIVWKWNTKICVVMTIETTQ